MLKIQDELSNSGSQTTEQNALAADTQAKSFAVGMKCC
jgi:hypothetical protein